MRAVAKATHAFALAGIAAALSGLTFAQPDSAPAGAPASPPEASAVNAPEPIVTSSELDTEEITIRGRRKTLGQYRVELQEAREELIDVYNEQNSGTKNDVTCRDERSTGTRMPQRVCRSNAQTEAEAAATRAWLTALVNGAGIEAGSHGNPAGVAAGARANAVAASSRSSAEIEKELEQLARENRTVYRAVVKYIEAEDTYIKARDEITARGDGQ